LSYRGIKIHPKFYPNCQVYHNGQVVMTCGATVPELHVEVWSGSHPFFTGKQTFVDAAGRVEKFQRKYAGNYFGAGKRSPAQQPQLTRGPRTLGPLLFLTRSCKPPQV
jgi:large subunit ribosomal protein L31